MVYTVIIICTSVQTIGAPPPAVGTLKPPHGYAPAAVLLTIRILVKMHRDIKIEWWIHNRFTVIHERKKSIHLSVYSRYCGFFIYFL